MQAWRIGTDTPEYLAEDNTGAGARITGGRWNRPGGAVIYSAESIALATLETLVHLSSGGLPLNRYLVRIDIPDDVWATREDIVGAAPIGWDALPAGKVSLDFGDQWLRRMKSAILVVPSVIVPEERDLLINPLHPGSKDISFCKQRRWLYDSRLHF